MATRNIGAPAPLADGAAQQHMPAVESVVAGQPVTMAMCDASSELVRARERMQTELPRLPGEGPLVTQEEVDAAITFAEAVRAEHQEVAHPHAVPVDVAAALQQVAAGLAGLQAAVQGLQGDVTGLKSLMEAQARKA